MKSGKFHTVTLAILFSGCTILSGFTAIKTDDVLIRTALAITDTVPLQDSNDTKIFETVEKEAYFPGGDEGWLTYLTANLNPNKPVENGAPEGTYTVYIQFIVSNTGKISAIKPLTKHGFGMEAEVIRIIRKSPDWVPAMQLGKPVNAYRKQPVTFQISSEKTKRKKRG
jgi:Gram-negative bacterial TonB protein C-terminal